MRIFTLCLLSLLFLSGCREKDETPRAYKNDRNISDEKGNPADSNVSYYPQKLFVKGSFFSNSSSKLRDSMDYKMKIWDFNIFSKIFIAFKEPVLYNYYLNKDVIRLLWSRSFHRPVLIRMEKDGDDVTLTTKILNSYPQSVLPKKVTIKFLPPFSKRSKHRKSPIIIEDPEPEEKIDVHFDVNKTIKLSLKEWDIMLNKLNEADFFHMTPYSRDIGLDGSDWLLETHLSESYYYVFRWTPRGAFRTCGEYLISLSEAKNEARY